MAAGWFKLYRSLLDHPVMQDDWHCRLFVWCLIKANWKSSEFKGQLLLPGQFITGRNSGSDELSVSPSKFKRGLDVLADRFGCISLQPNNQFTTVTVCHWSRYQDADDTARTTDEQPPTQPLNNPRTAGDATDEHIQRMPELPRIEESKNQPTTPNPPPDEWDAVVVALRAFGLARAEAAVKEARERGFHPEQIIDWLIWLNESTPKGAIGPGAILDRIRTSGAIGWPVDQGWPPPDKKAQEAHRRQALTAKPALGDRDALESALLESKYGAQFDSMTMDEMKKLCPKGSSLLKAVADGVKTSGIRFDLLRRLEKQNSS